MLLLLGQGRTRLAVVRRLRLWSSTFAFPSGKGSGRLGALLLASWLFTGHERNIMPLPNEVHPVALLPPRDQLFSQKHVLTTGLLAFCQRPLGVNRIRPLAGACINGSLYKIEQPESSKGHRLRSLKNRSFRLSAGSLKSDAFRAHLFWNFEAP